MAVPAPHSKQFLHRFLAKGIVSYRQIISSRLHVCQKELVHSLAEHFQTPVYKLNNLNVDYMKIP